MHIYFDESIHDQAGFMVVAFVVCENDPQEELLAILNQYELDEYHSCTNMSTCKDMQALRNDFRSFINHKCRWGIIILPNTSRRCLIDDLKKTIVSLQNKISISSISFDEGLINKTQAENLKSDLSISNITVESSHSVLGIQLSDLVAALCGVRLRSEVMDTHKMLIYGEEHGYEPPIEAPLAWELWTTLRYSMLYHYHDILENDDMPEFDTKEIGYFISQECNPELVEKAEKLFASVYLGCIH
jgi:hypothetical protein